MKKEGDRVLGQYGFRLALWDKEAGRLVPFRALRKLRA